MKMKIKIRKKYLRQVPAGTEITLLYSYRVPYLPTYIWSGTSDR